MIRTSRVDDSAAELLRFIEELDELEARLRAVDF
jgi:hypothetical protein